LAISQEDRCTIGGDDAQQQAGPVRDQSIGTRPFVMRNSFASDDGGWRMDLMDAGQRRAGQSGVGGKAAVGFDRMAIVAASQSAIETRYRARRDATGAPEKSVWHAVQHPGADDVETHSFSRMTMSSSAWLPTMK
jgi:hypothetical protein